MVLNYETNYKLVGNKWYFLSAKSTFLIKVIDREERLRTRFNSVSEILTTNIEHGDLQHFSKKELFKPNEFITEKIDTFDRGFWENYNVIQPEDELIKAIRNFENYNLLNSSRPVNLN